MDLHACLWSAHCFHSSLFSKSETHLNHISIVNLLLLLSDCKTNDNEIKLRSYTSWRYRIICFVRICSLLFKITNLDQTTSPTFLYFGTERFHPFISWMIDKYVEVIFHFFYYFFYIYILYGDCSLCFTFHYHKITFSSSCVTSAKRFLSGRPIQQIILNGCFK